MGGPIRRVGVVARYDPRSTAVFLLFSSCFCSTPIRRFYSLPIIYDYYKAYAAFTAPCVGHKDDESQAHNVSFLVMIRKFVIITNPVIFRVCEIVNLGNFGVGNLLS